MSADGNDGSDVSDSLVLAAFDDPEPLTAPEVAAATGLDHEEATAALERLVGAGRLGEKVVAEDVRLWYPTPGGGNGSGRGSATTDTSDPERTDAEPSEGSEADGWDSEELTVQGSGLADPGPEYDERQLEAAVADLEVPGTSEMMRDWRRSAVRAAFDHVHQEGETTGDDLVDAVYAGHQAGYDDPEAWYDCVAPRLETLPGVQRDGDTWTFADIT